MGCVPAADATTCYRSGIKGLGPAVPKSITSIALCETQ
jgi:hypothetical protein